MFKLKFRKVVNQENPNIPEKEMEFYRSCRLLGDNETIKTCDKAKIQVLRPYFNKCVKEKERDTGLSYNDALYLIIFENRKKTNEYILEIIKNGIAELESLKAELNGLSCDEYLSEQLNEINLLQNKAKEIMHEITVGAKVN